MPLLRRLLLSAAAMLVLGAAAGVVWALLATPAEWQVRETGLAMNEAGSKGQFSVIVVFVLVGAVACLLWGGFVAWTLRDLGWIVIPFIVVMTSVAAVIAWRLGIRLGPPDPQSVTGVSVGDRIPAKLAIDAFAPFVVWPVFGLLGVLCGTAIGLAREPLPDPWQHQRLTP